MSAATPKASQHDQNAPTANLVAIEEEKHDVDPDEDAKAEIDEIKNEIQKLEAELAQKTEAESRKRAISMQVAALEELIEQERQEIQQALHFQTEEKQALEEEISRLRAEKDAS